MALQQEREGEEPIYQNLPLLQKLYLTVSDTEDNLEESDHSEVGSIHIDDTVDGVPLGGEGGIAIDKSFVRDNVDVVVGDASAVVLPNIVSRVGHTTSREDITQLADRHWDGKLALRTAESPEAGKIFSEGKVLYSARGGQRRLEMRQYLEPAVQDNIRSLDESLVNTVNSSSLSLARLGSDSFNRFPSDLSTSETVRAKSVSSVGSEETLASNQGRSKGRKRWGLNMGAKSGSLKSNKSEKSDGGSKSGDESHDVVKPSW